MESDLENEEQEFDKDQELEMAQEDTSNVDEESQGEMSEQGGALELDLGSDSDESELEIEKQARELDDQALEDEEMAEQELKTNIEEREKFVLPSGQEVEQASIVPEDITLVQTRMTECVRVLNNFKELKEDGRYALVTNFSSIDPDQNTLNNSKGTLPSTTDTMTILLINYSISFPFLKPSNSLKPQRSLDLSSFVPILSRLAERIWRRL